MATQNEVGGKMINTNDPLENPETSGHLEPSKSPAPPPPRPRPKQESERASRDDVDFRQSSNSSPPIDGGRGQLSNRSAGGSDGSLHPNYPAKVTGGGGGSRTWKRRIRDILKPTRPSSYSCCTSQSPEKGDSGESDLGLSEFSSGHGFAPRNPSYPRPSKPPNKPKTRCFPFRFW